MIHGGLKLLRITNAIQRYEAHILRPGDTSKIVAFRWQGWSADCACRWNHGGKLKRIHASPCQGLVRVLQEPEAVVPIRDHVRGDHHPSAGVRCRGLLAVPKVRLSHIDGRLGNAIFVNENPLQAPMLGPLFDLRESLPSTFPISTR